MGRTNSYAYRANVTNSVTGAGFYTVAAVAGGGNILAEGASLVIFYRNSFSLTQRFLALYDGNDVVNANNTFIQNGFTGWQALGGAGSARTTFIVGDGHPALNENAVFVGSGGFQNFSNIFTGANGNFWDTRTLDVSDQVGAGSVSAAALIHIPLIAGDCVMWAAQVMAVNSSVSDVLVNNPAADGTSANDTQSTTTVSVRGSTVLVGFFDTNAGAGHLTGWSRSTNAGLSFTDLGAPPASANGADKADIFFRQSTNGGASWGPAVRVNADATTNDNWQPALAINPAGTRLLVSWYDRRLDPRNQLVDRWDRLATISGATVTFGAETRVSDVSFLPSTATMGVYDQVDADNFCFYETWTDTRLPSTASSASRRGTANNDVRLDRRCFGKLSSEPPTSLTGGGGGRLEPRPPAPSPMGVPAPEGGLSQKPLDQVFLLEAQGLALASSRPEDAGLADAWLLGRPGRGDSDASAGLDAWLLDAWLLDPI